ncbi:hypothetical protein NUBL21990_39120 [Klebsiella pneumoniae]|nr:hypothetical protein NUBL21990_39120 [Klebsiella pneumoniae]GKN96876.1 hypothetical protein MS5797_32820 [Klebsiella pneumoniae]
MCASYSAAVASSLLISYSAFQTPWAFGEARFADLPPIFGAFHWVTAEIHRDVVRFTED